MMWMLVSLWLTGCSYEAPLAPGAQPLANSISGSVVLSGVDRAATVAVLVYRADDPPPPAGTGAPVTLSMVPASAFNGATGLLEASYLVSELPDGDYLVNALMDVDGDFHPLLSSNAGATCGDFAGTYPVSATELSSAVVSVQGGELLEGVTVVVALEYPTERPAFVLEADASVSLGASGGLFTLSNTGIHSTILEFSDPGEACGPLFLVRFTDDDGDSLPDLHPLFGELGFLNAWPKVYLSYLGDGEVLLEPGERYYTEAPIYPALFQDPKTGAIAVDTLIPTPSLSPYFIPAVVHERPDGTAETISAADIPQGSWGVTVVSETGQTWTLPNEIAGFPGTDPNFDPILQAGVLRITE